MTGLALLRLTGPHRRRIAKHAAILEVGDLFGAESEFGQDFVVVLTE